MHIISNYAYWKAINPFNQCVFFQHEKKSCRFIFLINQLFFYWYVFLNLVSFYNSSLGDECWICYSRSFFRFLIRFIMFWKMVLIWEFLVEEKFKIFSRLAPTKFVAWWGWNSELAFLFRCTCLKPDVYFCSISCYIKTEIEELYRNNTGA